MDELEVALRELESPLHHDYTICDVLREIHRRVKNIPDLERRVVLAMLMAKRMNRKLRELHAKTRKGREEG